MSHSMSSSSDTVNLTLLGDGSVGKSSIIRAFRVDGFSRIYEQVLQTFIGSKIVLNGCVLLQTVGCDFFEKKMTIKGDMIISMRVYGTMKMNCAWTAVHPHIAINATDVGGQSINSKNLRQYLSGTSIVFLVYDLTSPESFRNLDDWLTAARKYSQKARIYLIGNKVCFIVQTSNIEIILCTYIRLIYLHFGKCLPSSMTSLLLRTS